MQVAGVEWQVVSVVVVVMQVCFNFWLCSVVDGVGRSGGHVSCVEVVMCCVGGMYPRVCVRVCAYLLSRLVTTTE